MRGTYGSPAEHHQKSVLELTKERNRLGFRAIVIYYSAYTNVGHAKVPVGVIVVIYLFKRSHIFINKIFPYTFLAVKIHKSILPVYN